MNRIREKWIGDKNFYNKVRIILIPMIVQQGITNLVNLLDNLMVGQLGTARISGVAVANQLVFVFNLMIFGILAGSSIYGAQFYGKGDYKGYHQTVRFRLAAGILLGVLGWLVFTFWGRTLFEMYLGGNTQTETLLYAGKYMKIICWQLILFAVIQGLGGALKDCNETRIPMQASVLAIFTNLTLNYLLIYGKLGFPEMGVEGAALATVIARYLEFAFLLLRIRGNWEKLPFLHGVFDSLAISRAVLKNVILTGTPLFANETLWSVGLTIINSFYAKRSIEAVTATNIYSTVWNLFGIVLMAMGMAVGILSGQRLGAGDFEGAKDTVRKMIFLSVVLNVFVGLAIIGLAPFIPQLYQTEAEVRRLAMYMLMICGLMMPVTAYTNASYFILRSGGKTGITFLFDSGFIWAVCIPVAWLLSRFTTWNVIVLYACVQALEFVKVIIATILLKSGIWINNILPD